MIVALADTDAGAAAIALASGSLASTFAFPATFASLLAGVAFWHAPSGRIAAAASRIAIFDVMMPSTHSGLRKRHHSIALANCPQAVQEGRVADFPVRDVLPELLAA